MYSLPPDYDKSYSLSDGYPKIYNKIQKIESKGIVPILDELEKRSVFQNFFLRGGGDFA
jgi:hypothetical protein